MEFIVKEQDSIKVQCLYYGNKRENMVSGFLQLHYGDIITISNHGKFVFDVGWFIFITINESTKEFVFFRDLEAAIHSKKLESCIDVILDYSLSTFYLDKSLVNRNKELFLSLSNKLSESSFLFHRITNKFPAENQT
ncbi:hypothetical protein F7731_25450 [Cytobacillus depressus]|uniref:IDEAL domain-containing protein n=1 Tax=Cytobacillus depressus TaxID=1602942 RepID=A0A6L3UZH7_9BACI|nr:hypothetical protein [Cytobacillus depressus]KAB2328475.1 hypothetical protein F7731_25450 [Cytobacillus depressus]